MPVLPKVPGEQTTAEATAEPTAEVEAAEVMGTREASEQQVYLIRGSLS